jgi:hypothetical protein
MSICAASRQQFMRQTMWRREEADMSFNRAAK